MDNDLLNQFVNESCEHLATIEADLLTIEEGGKPRADVAQGEIDWQGEVNRVVGVPLGEKVCSKSVAPAAKRSMCGVVWRA